VASIQKYTLNSGEDRWMYVIENGINPGTGKRSRVVKRGFKKERDAIKAARNAEYEMDKWNTDFATKITFGELAEEWLETYTINAKKKRTVRTRQYQLNHLLKIFKYVKVKDINSITYQKFLNSLYPNLKPTSISGINAVGSMIFKYAMEKNIISINPTQFVKIPRPLLTVEELEKKVVTDEYFEKDELIHFLEVCKESKHDDDYFIFSMLAWTGLRIGELCALKWSDVNLEWKTVSITKTIDYEGNNSKKFELTPPKTDGSIRLIDIENEVVELLKQHKSKQNQVKLLLGKDYTDFNLVLTRLFAPYYGYPYYPHLVDERMKRLMEKADLEKHLTPHSFRHTHTSLLAEAEVPLELIMERLGHEDESTTKKVYLHVTKQRKKDASKKFGELMRGIQNQ